MLLSPGSVWQAVFRGVPNRRAQQHERGHKKYKLTRSIELATMITVCVRVSRFVCFSASSEKRRAAGEASPVALKRVVVTPREFDKNV